MKRSMNRFIKLGEGFVNTRYIKNIVYKPKHLDKGNNVNEHFEVTIDTGSIREGLLEFDSYEYSWSNARRGKGKFTFESTKTFVVESQTEEFRKIKSLIDDPL